MSCGWYSSRSDSGKGPFVVGVVVVVVVLIIIIIIIIIHHRL
jgi:cell division protein FtsN